MEQPARKPRRQRHQRRQHAVDQTEGPRQPERQPVGMPLEERLGDQFAPDVKNKNRQRKHHQPQTRQAMEPAAQFDQADAEDDEVDHRVAHQDGPEEIFRVLQEAVQHPGPLVPGAHQLADAKMIQGQHARFHPGKEEGEGEADQQDQGGQQVPVAHGDGAGTIIAFIFS